MVHDAIIIINEIGTEAAAVTVMSFTHSASDKAIIFNANHTF